jgi:hypothetical protein
MKSDSKQHGALRCSFCGRRQSKETSVMVGPENVCICAECAKRCCNLLHQVEVSSEKAVHAADKAATDDAGASDRRPAGPNTPSQGSLASGSDRIGRHRMSQHAKSIRRRILLILYDQYLENPLNMPTPQDVLEHGTVPRADLMANMHYLSDRGLVELMMGYNPPLFAAARITADGIDLVENPLQFDLWFPETLSGPEQAVAEAPELMERLVAEADFAPLDGEKRRCLLRDVQYLRDELARPAERWRIGVIETVLTWLEAYDEQQTGMLPSLTELRKAIRRHAP